MKKIEIKNIQTHEDDTWLYGDRMEGDTKVGEWMQLKEHKRFQSAVPKKTYIANMKCPHDMEVPEPTQKFMCCICGKEFKIEAWEKVISTEQELIDHVNSLPRNEDGPMTAYNTIGIIRAK